MRLRGYLALGVVCLGFVASDVFQRFVISPWVKLRPSSRLPVMERWINALARLCIWPFVSIGGASIPSPARTVPSGPGILIVMNHQSLFDIPLVVQTVKGGYPRIITRARYRRFIPLISHLVRLYQYPTVDPTANAAQLRASLDAIGRAGRESDVPIALFPEGTRSTDGEIGRFKTRGIARLLAERPWTVYVFVGDGFWKHAKFKDFLLKMGRMAGKVEHVDTMEWVDPTADPTPFLEEIRSKMIDHLATIRAKVPSA